MIISVPLIHPIQPSKPKTLFSGPIGTQRKMTYCSPCDPSGIIIGQVRLIAEDSSGSVLFVTAFVRLLVIITDKVLGTELAVKPQ